MKAWLKGGLIGIGIYLIGLISLVVTNIFIFMQTPGSLIIGNSLKNYDTSLGIITIIFATVINLIIYFIAGALIGWFVGKMKQKKEN